MSNDEGAEGLQRVRRKSTKFASKASALNKAIITVEDHLKQLDGKVFAEVDLNGGTLSFKRSGNDWFLVYSEEVGFGQVEETIVRNADIPTKAMAARSLPLLVKLIETRHDELIQRLDGGLDALATIPWLASESESNDGDTKRPPWMPRKSETSDDDLSDLFGEEVAE